MRQAQHPLYASDVMIWAGMRYGQRDDLFLTECPQCGRAQTLAEAPIEAAEGSDDVSVYRCINGCALLAVTSLPGPVPPGVLRLALGEFFLGALAPAGLAVSAADNPAVLHIPARHDSPRRT